MVATLFLDALKTLDLAAIPFRRTALKLGEGLLVRLLLKKLLLPSCPANFRFAI